MHRTCYFQQYIIGIIIWSMLLTGCSQTQISDIDSRSAQPVTSETLIQFEEITRVFGSNVWPPVPQDTRVRETAAYGQTLWEYSPDSSSVEGFADGRQHLGGYRQVLGRMLEVIDG